MCGDFRNSQHCPGDGQVPRLAGHPPTTAYDYLMLPTTAYDCILRSTTTYYYLLLPAATYYSTVFHTTEHRMASNTNVCDISVCPIRN